MIISALNVLNLLSTFFWLIFSLVVGGTIGLIAAIYQIKKNKQC